MKKILLISVLGFGLAGCVTPSYNSIPRTKSVSYPELNQITTANVGDQMVAQGTLYNQDALVVSSVEKLGATQLTLVFIINLEITKTDLFLAL